jgi:hypothetical protein
MSTDCTPGNQPHHAAYAATYACPHGFSVYSIEVCHYRSYISPENWPECARRCDGKWRWHVPGAAWRVCRGCGTLGVFDWFDTCVVCGAREGEGEV